MPVFFSIAIPTYEMNGQGVDFLEFSFKKIHKQTFKNFELVISDHSKNNDIQKLCTKWKNLLNVRYYKNDTKRGSSSANINFAISKCKGVWIKILFQDDFLFHEDSLLKIYNFLQSNPDSKWLASGCEHTKDGKTFINRFIPKWNSLIHLGQNTISSPSVISLRNDLVSQNKVLFDERLIWLMDVDFYKKLYNKYGPPAILEDINVVNRLGEHRLSSLIEEQTKNKEVELMFNLYGV